MKRIIVVTLDGKHLHMEIDPEETVRSLKDRIKSLLNRPDTVRLKSGEFELKCDDKTMLDSHIYTYPMLTILHEIGYRYKIIYCKNDRCHRDTVISILPCGCEISDLCFECVIYDLTKCPSCGKDANTMIDDGKTCKICCSKPRIEYKPEKCNCCQSNVHCEDCIEFLKKNYHSYT